MNHSGRGTSGACGALVLSLLIVAGAGVFAACGETSTPPTGTQSAAASTPTASPSEPASSAPSAVGTIAFVKVKKAGEERASDIYVIRTDGSGLRSLTTSSDPEIAPVWSPGGSKIAYIGKADSGGAVCVMNADGSGERRLTESLAGTDYSVDCPSWSPDGKRIVYMSIDKVTMGWHLDVVNADGSGQTELTSVGSMYPIWARDGTIFFDNTDLGEVCTVDPGGGSPQGTGIPAEESRFSLSPDGKQLVMPEGNMDRIALYKTSGQGGAVALVEELSRYSNGDQGWSADWSPDGHAIAFAFAHDGGPGTALYIVNVDGSGLRQVPNTGEVWDPVWQPR